AERIAAEDGRYDAVFELAIFHHVPGWRHALAEVRRVLRPGGVFLFEELSREFFSEVPVLSPLLRRFTEHPWDTMFDFPEFRRAPSLSPTRPPPCSASRAVESSERSSRSASTAPRRASCRACHASSSSASAAASPRTWTPS